MERSWRERELKLLLLEPCQYAVGTNVKRMSGEPVGSLEQRGRAFQETNSPRAFLDMFKYISALKNFRGSQRCSGTLKVS
jgi:hypothetical protein